MLIGVYVMHVYCGTDTQMYIKLQYLISQCTVYCNAIKKIEYINVYISHMIWAGTSIMWVTALARTNYNAIVDSPFSSSTLI